MKKLHTYLLFVVILIGEPGYGQYSRKIVFQSLEYGLSNPRITCIHKDSKGFMWFGTVEGLNKFDGTRFTLYENDINDSSSLVNNNVNTIFEDKRHNIWIGSTTGVCFYNRERDNFRVFRDVGSTRFNYVNSFFEDDYGNIWIGTSGQGLYLFHPESNSFSAYSHDNNDPGSVCSDFINAIISDTKGRIWLATQNGLDIFDYELKKFIHFTSDHILAEELKNSNVKRICFDNDGNLWAGTYAKGLFKITDQGDEWQIRNYTKSALPGSISANDILSLMCDRNGTLWVGTENGGLCILPADSETFTVYKTVDGNTQSISSNSIWSLYQDDTGIIWIGTYNHGLNYIDERIEKFEIHQRNPYETSTLVNNNVMNFSDDANGNIWIATDGGGLSTFDIHSRSFTNKIDNDLVSSKACQAVLCDSKQRIWVGTWGGGIDLFDSTGKKIRNFKLEAHSRPGNIFSLLEDHKGQIWAGTARNGLLVFDSDSFTFQKIIDHSSKTQLTEDAFVMALYQDDENTLWVGVSFSLIQIKTVNGKRVFTEYQHSANPNSISSFNIATIFEDSRHNLWIGTDDGLNLFNKEKGTFTVFRKEDGLPNNTINGILEDNNYCLWISTFGGISKFDIEHKTFKNYSIDDGLLSDNFNPRAYMKTQSGEFFFGNNNGFISFYPDSIKMNTYIPPVYFTGFKTFNNTAKIGEEGSPLKKNISETKRLTLNHKQTSFLIEFVALNYTHSAKNQYAYMLEGFDKDWFYSGRQNYATYTNIDAGKYIFKVKGSNNEGIWNPNPIQMEIIVLPPFWKTTWAYAFYAACIIAILWGFIKLRIIQSRQAEKLRLEKIHYEKSEELNRMKIQFFANISHEFRTPLSLILAPVKEIIKHESLRSHVKKSLEMVYHNANKLFGLVNELMDFTKSESGRLKMMAQKIDLVLFAGEVYKMFIDEAKRRNIDFRFETSFEYLDVWIDKGKMEKVISNLLSNAFKFTPDNGSIVIKTDQETINDVEYATVSVTDNGSGIAPEYLDKIFERFYQSPEKENFSVTGTGIGLALVKSLVELHHGLIYVTSKKNEQTCFTFKIPFGNEHFDKNEILDDTGEYFVAFNEKHVERNKSESTLTDKNKPLVLIIEDNSELREYLASILAPGYQILKAGDGMEGLKTAKEMIPDLIISDIGMPRLSGTELCKTIRKEMSTSHIPVVLLTAKASAADVIEGVGTGADAYITKPFDVQHLVITIEKLIETRQKIYQHFNNDALSAPAETSISNLDDLDDLDEQFLNKINDYIEENTPNSNISVENMAEHLFMNRTSMYRKIKAITGLTATEYIRTVLLNKAIKLLENEQYSISEIAYKVGFSSPGYFSRCFRDQFGMSPSEYLEAKKR